MTNKGYTNTPYTVFSSIKATVHGFFNPVHESYRASKKTFFFQLFALTGALYLTLKIFPLVAGKIPYVSNLKFIPEPWNEGPKLLLISFILYIVSLIKKIRPLWFFTISLPLALIVILLEIFCVISYFFAFKMGLFVSSRTKKYEQ